MHLALQIAATVFTALVLASEAANFKRTIVRARALTSNPRDPTIWVIIGITLAGHVVVLAAVWL